MSDHLIIVEGVSKKFCHSLKKSLWYGIEDLASELIGRRHSGNGQLRTDEFWAVNDVSFGLKRGECLGLVGRNGAGKSTVLKLLNGLIKPDRGRITIKGRVGSLIELNIGFNPILTGRENVYIYGSILGFSKKQIDEKYQNIVEFSELQDFMEMPFKSYSSGMKVRLGFAVAAQMEPDVLIIDEVLAVGDIGFRGKCYSFISKLMKKTAVIFVSHSMPEIGRLCNRIMLLEKGESKFQSNDIHEGIDRYYNAFKRIAHEEIKSVDGEFRNILINGLDTIERTMIEFNEDIVVQMSARINPKIKNPIFHVGILDQTLQNICHCSSGYSHQKFNSDNGKLNVEVTLKKTNIRPGIYYLDFAMTDSDNVRIIARTHLQHMIQVRGPFTGYGVTLAIGVWKHLNNV